MSHSSVAKSVRETKERDPSRFCTNERCLWNVARSGACPSHMKQAPAIEPPEMSVPVLKKEYQCGECYKPITSPLDLWYWNFEPMHNECMKQKARRCLSAQHDKMLRAKAPNRFRCVSCGEFQDETQGTCMTIEPDAGNPYGNAVLGAHVWVIAADYDKPPVTMVERDDSDLVF